MTEWARINIHRSVWITGLVVLAHAAALFWALSHRVGLPAAPTLRVLDIDFAEVPQSAKPKPQTALPVEPEQPVAKDRHKPVPGSRPAPASPSKTVLTQLDTISTATVPPPPSNPSAAVGATDTVDPGVLASVLRGVDCQRLSLKSDEDCPKPDPFGVATASMARQIGGPSSAPLVGDYGPKSMLEGFFSQRDKAPYLMPGMDGELFTSGMAPGAYDAQRIRNGDAPLWSKEMTDGFAKSD